jgi:hypothetical protein
VGCERCHRKTEIEAETKFYSLSKREKGKGTERSIGPE